MRSSVTVGTRRSPLARLQTQRVCEALQAAWPDLVITQKVVATEGDRNQGPLLGTGKGLFTSALEEALREGRIDFAVHSLKDLPTADPPDLVLGAIFDRATARDVLVANEPWTLHMLPEGAVVGTSSRRRRAQLLACRRDLTVVPIRGNVDTRLKKLREERVDALVLAQAGLVRLGIPHDPKALLPLSTMLPAPGQGALAVQCRRGEEALVQVLDCRQARQTTTAERAFLKALGGGCTAPIAAYAQMRSGGLLSMEGLVASLDGLRLIRVRGTGQRASVLGRRLARRALEHNAAEVLQRA